MTYNPLWLYQPVFRGQEADATRIYRTLAAAKHFVEARSWGGTWESHDSHGEIHVFTPRGESEFTAYVIAVAIDEESPKPDSGRGGIGRCPVCKRWTEHITDCPMRETMTLGYQEYKNGME